MRRMKWLVPLLLLAVVPGCKPKPAKVEVLPASLKFNSPGDTVILMATVTDKAGAQVEHAPCVYVTGDPLIAEVRQDGTVIANGSGSTEIRVTCQDVAARIPVKVALPTKLTIDARCESRCSLMATDPLALKLEGVGAGAKLSAIILDDQGEPVPVEPKWEIVDPDFRAGARRMGVEVSKEGELKSTGQVGKYLVMVTAGSLVTRGNVEVTLPVVDIVKAQGHLWVKPGAEAQIQPQGFRRALEGNRPVAGAKFTYTSNKPEVARVNDEGKVTGVAEGTTEIVVAADSGSFAQVGITCSEKDPVAVPEPPAPAPKKKK